MTAPKPKTDGREKRALIAQSIELREAGEGEERIAEGYAVLWDNDANIYDLWVESFSAGAFDNSLSERDVIAIHSHDFSRIVGRKDAGTLTLRSDSKGLYFENTLPDTSDGRDLGVQIDRGDIAGMSFGFRAVKQEWDDTVDPPKRTITEAELYEITYTAIPAYDDTEVGMRSLEAARAEKRSHNKVAATARIRMRQAQAERKI
ncbi:MAG: HK97 family phage prohead protease [Pseudomonadota bacterium]